MIDINKQYRTRDGREVRIYATDGGDLCENRTIHGAVLSGSNWVFAVWNAMNGKCYASVKQDMEIDLIEVRPRHKRTVWLNVFHHNVMAFFTNEGAKSNGYGRIACIKVELDFEEGEGLNTSSERVKKTGES
jgi:hypothetical protein